METTAFVRIYRVLVLALVCFYFLYNFHPNVWESQIGWSWRFLTNWAQALSLIVAALMVGRSFGMTTAVPDALVSVTVVANIMVVYLYWDLYFEDPLLVSADGPPVWWREFYVHLIGPLLQWIDAFLIFGCFRRPVRFMGGMIALSVAYNMWTELILRPFSNSPVGEVTSGLPYPFLNNMTLDERLVFYGVNLGLAFALALICGLIALALRRFAGLGRE